MVAELNNQASKKLKNNWWFIVIAAVVYLAAGYFFIRKFGEPLTPFRGATSDYVNLFVLIFDLLSMLFLIMFVINTTWLCKGFINQFTKTCIKKTLNVPKLFSGRCSLENDKCGKKGQRDCREEYAKCLNKYARQMTNNTLAYWFTIKVIGEKTKVVGEMIKYPFLILLLNLVSRHKYFDNWTWTIPLAIVIGLTTLIALICTIILFYGAIRARNQIVARLHEEEMMLINTQLPEEVDAFDDKKLKLVEQQINSKKSVLNEIHNLKIGAYTPILSFNNPIILAILTPLGGMGSISIMQQFFRFIKD